MHRLLASKVGRQPGPRYTFRNYNSTARLHCVSMRIEESAAVPPTGGNLDGRGRIPDEQRLLNAGLFYGAGASEAPMCAGKKVFIVGGGNSAGQAAMNFARTAESVRLIVRGPSLAATLSHYLLDRIARTSNVRVVFESSVSGIYDDTQLEALRLTNKAGGTQA